MFIKKKNSIESRKNNRIRVSDEKKIRAKMEQGKQ